MLPLLAGASADLEAVIVTSYEGDGLLGAVDGEVVKVPLMATSPWEQWGLPRQARRLGARAIYMHSECSPLWGPPVLLHVPEDPHVRWEATPVTSWKEHARRSYERLVMRASIKRAPLLVTSCSAVTTQLEHRFGPLSQRSEVVPLGVDATLFYPQDDSDSSTHHVFHLGSDEARDQSRMVVQAYAFALHEAPDLPDLVIAGNLGQMEEQVRQEVDRLGVAGRVNLVGRVSDEDLRLGYGRSVACLQPAHYEGFGLQPLEALACGAPLVVFSDPAVKEVVGGAAVVVEERSATSLGGALAGLWASPERRAELRRLGPSQAAQFTWEATAARLRALLDSLVAPA